MKLINRYLYNRNFIYLWLAAAATTLGTELYNIAVVVAIFDQSASAIHAASVFAARMLPAIIIGPVAGALLDQYPRRPTLLVLNLLRIGILALAFGYTRYYALNNWAIYAIVSSLALLDALYIPSQFAFLPQLVDRNQLLRANSLIMTSNHAILVVAYALAGLVTLVGLPNMILLDLFVFVGAGLLIFGISVSTATNRTYQPSLNTIRQEIKNGFTYLYRTPLVRSLVALEFLEHWPHGAWSMAVMLAFTERNLQAGANAYGLQASLFFAGQLLGGVVAVIVARWLAARAGKVVIINSLVNALLSLFYGLNRSVSVAMGINLCFGPPTAMRDILQDAMLQSHVDEQMLARIYAIRQTLVNSNYLAASFVFAWLADRVSIELAYVIAALLYGLVATYAACTPLLRRSQIGDHSDKLIINHPPAIQPHHAGAD